MAKPDTQLIVLTGIKVLAALGVVWVVYQGVGSLFPQDSWPPKDERAEKEMIAKYKAKLAMGDSPLSPRTPDDTARYLSRIIDFEVQKGEPKVGREYIVQAIGQKMDDRVESLTNRPESKELIVKMRNALKKRDELSGLISFYGRRPGATASKEQNEKFERDFKELSAQYCRISFDPSACPEVAEEIEKMYRAKLEPAKQDPRWKDVVESMLRQ
jgi:hypothetical protein